ncbi:programmed cell death protein 10-like isoform X2 [Mustelus asterias]
MGTAPAIANPTVTMALYTVMYPVFSELEEVHSAAAQNLKAIFTEAEMKTPGLCQELLLKLLEQESVDLDVSYTEALLRMSGQDAQGPLDQGEEREELSELRKKGRALRNILSSIADDINEKKRFMLTIRVSAVAIKDLLTTVSDMIKEFPPSMHQDLIHRRREFLIASKSFSDTLKKYFRDHRLLGKARTSLALLPRIRENRFQPKILQSLQEKLSNIRNLWQPEGSGRI